MAPQAAHSSWSRPQWGQTSVGRPLWSKRQFTSDGCASRCLRGPLWTTNLCISSARAVSASAAAACSPMLQPATHCQPSP